MLFHRTQEAEVVLRETKEEDAPTDQTSAKIDSGLSHDNEGFVLDLTSSSNNIAEVRQSRGVFLFFLHLTNFTISRSPRDASKREIQSEQQLRSEQ